MGTTGEHMDVDFHVPGDARAGGARAQVIGGATPACAGGRATATTNTNVAMVHWWKKGLWSRFATAISRGCATATDLARLKAPPH